MPPKAKRPSRRKVPDSWDPEEKKTEDRVPPAQRVSTSAAAHNYTEEQKQAAHPYKTRSRGPVKRVVTPPAVSGKRGKRATSNLTSPQEHANRVSGSSQMDQGGPNDLTGGVFHPGVATIRTDRRGHRVSNYNPRTHTLTVPRRRLADRNILNPRAVDPQVLPVNNNDSAVAAAEPPMLARTSGILNRVSSRPQSLEVPPVQRPLDQFVRPVARFSTATPGPVKQVNGHGRHQLPWSAPIVLSVDGKERESGRRATKDITKITVPAARDQFPGNSRGHVELVTGDPSPPYSEFDEGYESEKKYDEQGAYIPPPHKGHVAEVPLERFFDSHQDNLPKPTPGGPPEGPAPPAYPSEEPVLPPPPRRNVERARFPILPGQYLGPVRPPVAQKREAVPRRLPGQGRRIPHKVAIGALGNQRLVRNPKHKRGELLPGPRALNHNLYLYGDTRRNELLRPSLDTIRRLIG